MLDPVLEFGIDKIYRNTNTLIHVNFESAVDHKCDVTEWRGLASRLTEFERVS